MGSASRGMEAPPSASAQHLKVEIDRAALEKIELEKKEIALRIDNLSNWKRKWAQTAISFLVPIATAAIALLAAYADLRSVREERTQLADTERDFEKQKAADYAVTKVNRAIELLGVGQNKAPLGRAAVLDALQDLMRAGAKLPETSVDIIFPLLLDPDPRVAKSAQSILDGSASPNYAKSFANALLVATPPVNYKLASLLMSANLGHQNLSYIAPLSTAGDSVVAGDAIRALAQNVNVPLNTLVHLDDGSSPYERMAYLFTSLIMKDRAAQKSSLKYLADKLLSGKSFGTSSNEFFSACAVNQQGDVYGGNVFQRADISSANKILLATTGPKFMRAPGAELARKIFQDVKETAKLALADIDIDFISSALGVSKPAFTIADFGSYSLEEISAVAKYMRFDNVPRATLVKLRHDLKSSGIFADTSGIDNAIIIQDGYDMLAAKSDGLGVDEFLMRATASREKTAIDAAYVVFGEALRKRTERPESFSTYEIDVAANLVKAGKPNDLFDEIYADSPFDFLADFDKVAEADRAYALRFLRAIVLSKAVTARQGFMIAIKAGLDSEFSVLAKEAFDEQLNDIALIRQSDLREHPDYKEGSVDAALLVLSFLTESPDFKRDVDKLRATIAALGLVPSRGLGVTASVLNGSFGVERKDGYAELAQVFVPDVLRAIKATGCDGHAYQSLIESDQLKDVVWGAILD